MDNDDRYIRITLRMPKDLHEKLTAAADATSKSMNAEIIARLQESFSGTSYAQPLAVRKVSEALKGAPNSKAQRVQRLQREVIHVGVAIFEVTTRLNVWNLELISVISDEDRERLNNQIIDAHLELAELESKRRVLSLELNQAQRELVEDDLGL